MAETLSEQLSALRDKIDQFNAVYPETKQALMQANLPYFKDKSTEITSEVVGLLTKYRDLSKGNNELFETLRKESIDIFIKVHKDIREKQAPLEKNTTRAGASESDIQFIESARRLGPIHALYAAAAEKLSIRPSGGVSKEDRIKSELLANAEIKRIPKPKPF